MASTTLSPARSEDALDRRDSTLRSAIFGYVFNRVRDRFAAEDLTQEVLIRAIRRKETVRNPERLDGWVFGIARNAVADYFRKARPTEVFSEAVHGAVEDGAEPMSQEDEALRKKLGEYLREVVEGLPARYREALIATEYDGLSQVELARREQISISAAKSRVQRARAMVRAEIERCCRWEMDRYGAVVDCQPNTPASCQCGDG